MRSTLPTLAFLAIATSNPLAAEIVLTCEMRRQFVENPAAESATIAVDVDRRSLRFNGRTFDSVEVLSEKVTAESEESSPIPGFPWPAGTRIHEFVVISRVDMLGVYAVTVKPHPSATRAEQKKAQDAFKVWQLNCTRAKRAF